MVLASFSQETDGFGKENQCFPRENQKTKTTIFWETMWRKSKEVGFPTQNHLFPRKKLVFLPKTIFPIFFLGIPAQNHFFLGKRWFWVGKPIFS